MPPPHIVGICKNMMVQYGGRIFLCNPEAVRPAVGFENWSPSPEDIADLRNAEEAIRNHDFIDNSDQKPPDDEPMDVEARLDEPALDPVSGSPVASGSAEETPAVIEPQIQIGPSPAPESVNSASPPRGGRCVCPSRSQRTI